MRVETPGVRDMSNSSIPGNHAPPPPPPPPSRTRARIPATAANKPRTRHRRPQKQQRQQQRRHLDASPETPPALRDRALALMVSPSPSSPPRRSPEDVLRHNFLTMMTRTQRTDSWYALLLPRRLGHARDLDAAATALIHAEELHILASSSSASPVPNSPLIPTESNSPIASLHSRALAAYGTALTLLRDRIYSESSGSTNSHRAAPASPPTPPSSSTPSPSSSSPSSVPAVASDDNALATIALLAAFERAFVWNSTPFRSHMHGLMAMLLARGPREVRASGEVARAVVYGFWPLTYFSPLVRGTASAFDSPDWLTLEPLPDVHVTPGRGEGTGRLRRVSFALFVRMPRLVMWVRRARERAGKGDVEVAMGLAKELLELRDEEAENELLHRVKVQKTGPDFEPQVAPYSMRFANLAEYEAALYYWASSILLRRLVWRLNGMFPDRFKASGLEPKAIIEAQISKTANNILMACEDGIKRGEIGEAGLLLGLIAVWGVLADFDVFKGRGVIANRARVLLRRGAQSVMRLPGPNSEELCEQRLTSAADLFAGIPTNGVVEFAFKR